MSVTLALLLDALIGDPPALWQRLPHPVALVGRLIAMFEARFNRRNRREGVILLSLLVAGAGLIGLGIEWLPGGNVLSLLAAVIMLAHGSLLQHVRAVSDGLDSSLEEGRQAVARIVGRDVRGLDEPGVVRAAVESAAENFSDGVVAPAFWYAVLGLPGILIYKAVNTADSMVGHRNERYEAFGWASARFDDLLNAVPARLAAVLIAGFDGRAHQIVRRDAGLHKSPSAGWPEAAMAARLGLSLAGPRSYHGRMSADPWILPEGRRDGRSRDIRRACSVLRQAFAFLLMLALLSDVVRW